GEARYLRKERRAAGGETPFVRSAHLPTLRTRPRTQSGSHPSIAASTFGGDIGNSVSRLPVARSIAFAIAAIGGQMLTSATPLAPYGWFGFGTSTSTGSI